MVPLTLSYVKQFEIQAEKRYKKIFSYKNTFPVLFLLKFYENQKILFIS